MKKNWRKYLYFLLALTIIISQKYFSQGTGENVQFLIITQNQSKEVTPGFLIGKVILGNPEICDFRVTKERKSILLTSKSLGTTNLIIYDQLGENKIEYQIKVVEDIKSIKTDLERLFKDVEGLKVSEERGKIMLEGNLFNVDDYLFVIKNIEGNPNIINRLKIDPDALQKLADKIVKDIGVEEVKGRVIRDKIFLEGDVATETELRKADIIANTYAPGMIVNAIVVNEKKIGFAESPHVHISTQIISLTESAASQLGIRWLETGYVGIQPSEIQIPKPGKITGIITGLLPKIDLLISEGEAQSLANATMVTKSGYPAHQNMGGGEYPVRVAQPGGIISIEYKEYGFIVDASPVVNRENNMVDVGIKAEIIALGTAAGDIPVFLKNEVNSSVTVPSGDSIILAGLLSENLRKQVQGLPGLGQIPILKTFFASTARAREKMEVYIALTPTVLQAGKGSEQDKKNLEELKKKLGIKEVIKKN
ncbi:MAG: pilus assembly protein N-terminal domain-containing protein [Acidobacteriota bacterium]